MTWAEIIAQARERGRFLPEEKRAAGRWDSCACRDVPDHGRYRASVSIKDGQPRDGILFAFGRDFEIAVLNDDIDTAESLDRSIRDRIAELYGAR